MAIGPWQLLIVLVIVVLLFGTKKLASLGTDLGGAMKGFKKAIKDDDEEATTQNKVAADDENKSN
jgi:sec-independent protein translocase protein TatA